MMMTWIQDLSRRLESVEISHGEDHPEYGVGHEDVRDGYDLRT